MILGKGPASSKPVRLTEMTDWRAEASQVMPTQLQGVLSLLFQEESELVGSQRPSLNWRR